MTRQLKPNQTQPEERLVPMRLQKFLARAGAASRRGSENLMTAGRVTVNGQVVTELGSKVDPLVDQVAVDGVPVRLEGGPVTIMLHKPAGCVTTMSDPQGRPTVAEVTTITSKVGCNIQSIEIDHVTEDSAVLSLVLTDEGDIGKLSAHLINAGFSVSFSPLAPKEHTHVG